MSSLRGLVGLLALVSSLYAHTAPLTFIHEVEGQDEPEVHLATATLLSQRFAIVCAHSVHSGEYSTGELRVGGVLARILRVDTELALLYLQDDWNGEEEGDDEFGPLVDLHVEDGEPLVHRWYDFRAFEPRSRVVTWAGDSYVLDDFQPGMSGSGVYKLTGELVGVVEWTSGFVWRTTTIRHFLEEAVSEYSH